MDWIASQSRYIATALPCKYNRPSRHWDGKNSWQVLIYSILYGEPKSYPTISKTCISYFWSRYVFLSLEQHKNDKHKFFFKTQLPDLDTTLSKRVRAIIAAVRAQRQRYLKVSLSFCGFCSQNLQRLVFQIARKPGILSYFPFLGINLWKHFYILFKMEKSTPFENAFLGTFDFIEFNIFGILRNVKNFCFPI